MRDASWPCGIDPVAPAALRPLLVAEKSRGEAGLRGGNQAPFFDL